MVTAIMLSALVECESELYAPRHDSTMKVTHPPMAVCYRNSTTVKEMITLRQTSTLRGQTGVAQPEIYTAPQTALFIGRDVRITDPDYDYKTQKVYLKVSNYLSWLKLYFAEYPKAVSPEYLNFAQHC